MSIQITSRYRPYTHAPGSRCLLPGTDLVIEAFPAVIKIYQLQAESLHLLAEISIELNALVSEFTIQQDCNRSEIQIWAKTPSFFLRYSIRPSENNLCSIYIHKHPSSGLTWQCHSPHLKLFKSDKEKSFHLLEGAVLPKDFLILAQKEGVSENKPVKAKNFLRLSLGNHKAQQWDKIIQRNDPIEFLPFWYAISQHYPNVSRLPIGGTSSLLEKCAASIKEKNGNQALSYLTHFFQAAFTPWLIPHFTDETFLGINLPKVSLSQNFSPIVLFSKSFELITGLFVSTETNKICILPALPSQFHCGRLLHICCQGKGWIDIEWSKKLIRRAVFWADSDGELSFSFQNEIKRFRMRSSLKEKGTIYHCPATLYFEKGRHYLFDNFEK